MKLFDCLLAFLLRLRRQRHRAWLRRNHVVLGQPQADHRDWQGAFRNRHDNRR